jgi:hypothetical protein
MVLGGAHTCFPSNGWQAADFHSSIVSLLDFKAIMEQRRGEWKQGKLKHHEVHSSYQSSGVFAFKKNKNTP